jgi:hypothetical protein
MRRLVLPALLAVLTASPSARGAEIEFTAESPEFAAATEEYRAIWKADGDRIADALHQATDLLLESEPIRAIVFEGVSSSGYHEDPMHLRASYPADTKRAILVHELSHRLVSDIAPGGADQHAVIFLFVYDVWTNLWGRDFADAQVAIESERRGIYDYEAAWRDALALGADGRAKRWSELLAEWRRNP